MKKLSLLSLLLTVSVFAVESRDLAFTTQPFGPATGAAQTLQGTLGNGTNREITDIDVDIVLTSSRPATVTATHHPAWPADQWTCTNVTAQHVRCRAPRLAPNSFIPLMITVDPVGEGRYSLVPTATWVETGTTLTTPRWSERAAFLRDVIVTTTADAGPGSLRAAIDYANDTCTRDGVPCAIRFLIEEALPASGWYTIRPLTQLPKIVASDITITNSAGDPQPPFVELDGSLLATGHGLEIAGEGPWLVDRLVIGGFPWDGIAVTRSGSQTTASGVVRSRLGTHPDDTPHPNGSRGITFNAPASYASVGNNIIQGNLRSGVFIASGHDISVTVNQIGRVDTAGRALSNGASGIFVGPEASNVFISTNYIRNNAHWGIAIARGARGVRIENSYLYSNASLPIDHGLDGFDGVVANRASFQLPAPRIVSTTYDQATGTTTITGTFDAPDPNLEWEATLLPISPSIWPEISFPTVRFTGTTFTATVTGFFQPPFGVVVNSAQPSDWSTSEVSELD